MGTRGWRKEDGRKGKKRNRVGMEKTRREGRKDGRKEKEERERETNSTKKTR